MHFKQNEISVNAKLFDEISGILQYLCVSVLNEGTSFGEKGVEDGTPRNATILCITDCFFCCIMKREYDLYLRDLTKGHLSKIRDFFFVDVFKKEVGRTVIDNLGPDFIKLILHLKKGDNLFGQNGSNDNVYIVRHGCIAIEKTMEDVAVDRTFMKLKKPQRVFCLCQLETSEIVGEECLFSNKPKTYTARVLSETASFYYTSKQTVRSYMNKSPHLREFLEGLFETRMKARQLEFDQFQKRELKLQEPVKVRGPLIRTKGAIVETWKTKRPAVSSPVTNMEIFDKVYHSELADFVRDKVPNRDPHFAMLKDFEISSGEIPIVKVKKSEVDSIVVEDYLMKGSEFSDLNKLRIQMNDPKRLVNLKLEAFHKRMAERRSRNKSIGEISLTSTSVDYPKSMDYAVDVAKIKHHIPIHQFSPVLRKIKGRSLLSVFGKTPSQASRSEMKSQRFDDSHASFSQHIGYSFDGRYKSLDQSSPCPSGRKSQFQERMSALILEADINKTERLLGKFRDSGD